VAKINIQIDTEEKTISANIDGKVINDVAEVTAYREEFDGDVFFNAGVSTVEDIDDKTKKVVRFVSSASVDGIDAMKKGTAILIDRFPGFVGIAEKTKVQRDIEAYFSKK